MKDKYICDECGLELSEKEYEAQDTSLCPECGGKISEHHQEVHDVQTGTTPPVDPMKQYPPGQGKGSPIPPEIKGWNWGAFLMNIVWGFGNGVYWQALVTLVPVVGMIMVFILGAKGNKWAWQNRPWDSIEHFKSVQRKWAIIGLVLFLVTIGSLIMLTLLNH